MVKVQIKKLTPTAKLPTKGSKYSAGYDLYADSNKEIIIPAHSTVKVGTGLSISPPSGYFGAIFARSGLATKQGLAPANKVGCCDEDYTGEYIVALHNDGNKDKAIQPYERIAQLVFLPYLSVDFEEVEKLQETDRGMGGFGSTGSN